MSSSHLILGPVFLRFKFIGNHSVTVLLHRSSSFILASCPADCHFSCFILTIMSCIPVCCLTHSATLSCFQYILHSFGYCSSLTPICHCGLYTLIIHFSLQA